MPRKGKSAVEGDPKKSWSGIKTEAGAEQEEAGLEVSLAGIHRKEGGPTPARTERKTPVLRPALQSKQSSPCGLHRSGDRGGGGPNGQTASAKRTADGRRQRSRKTTDEEGEKHRAKNGSPRNTPTDSKGTAPVILKNHRSAPVRKERPSPTSKARREASRNKPVEKGGTPDRAKSPRETDSRQDRPRARPGPAKPIRNGPRKVQNLIKCRPSRAETGPAGRENGTRPQKKEKTG